MEELPDDVGGGGDAEHDGSEDLLPPGQQQHGVLPPAALSSVPVPLYQADGRAAFLPGALAVGEVVPVVCGGDEVRSHVSAARCVPVQQALQYFVVVLRVLTIGVLKDGQGSVAVFVMGELVIVQTLVKFIGSDQGGRPRWGVCVKDKMSRFTDLDGKRDTKQSEESQAAQKM